MESKRIEKIVEQINKMEEEINNLKNSIGEFEEEAKEAKEWPQVGDEYYVIHGFGKICSWKYYGSEEDFNVFRVGNAFKTKEEAEFELERRKVITELKKYSKAYNPKVKNFCICYSYGEDALFPYLEPLDEPDVGAYYFESEKMAERAINEIGEDRIKKYLFRVGE